MRLSLFFRCRFFSLATLLLAAGGLYLAAAAPVFRELYVSPNGSDRNPGTQARPFRTIAHARDVVRGINGKMTGDIVVNLRGGTYAITTPIEFGAADSGINGFHVTYRAFQKEVPVISGGVPVTGWTLDHGKVYKAKLNRNFKLRSLYVNGVRAQMTHADFTGQGPWGEFVIKGDEPWAETPGKTFDGVEFNSAQVPVFANPSDVELLQHRTWNFLVMGVRDAVKENGYTVLKLQQPLGAIAATLAWHCYVDPKGAFTIRNAYELMKNPGEFYFNRVTHTLYYFSNGEDMSKAAVIAPLSEGLLRIAGKSPTDRAKNLVFTGLTFSYDHWQLEKVGDSRGMVGVQSLGLYTRFRADGNWHKSHYDVCDLPQATVDIRNAQDIRFERNRFVHLASGVGVSLVNDVVDSEVVGNVFNDLSGNAVNVGHPQHYIIGGGPLFKGIAGVCARDVIKDNWIRNVSLDFKQEEAISGFFTQSVEITHNDIQGTPYGGIALGWWWGNAEIPPSKVPKDNLIAYNRVVDTQQVLPRDGGAIYVLGEQPGGRIERNYIRSNTRCLYEDDGSAYWTITQNVVDPVDHRDIAAKKDGQWLFVWTPRIHDLKIDNNYTTLDKTRNEGTNTKPTNTHIDAQFPPEAQAIINAAGLEPAYKDIAEDTSTN
ncbi:MAG TPA: hypothetical protein VG675_01205 [Bryobacteraceae bacterium]|nr:hypothetical protein [Bryobacteraceae bacterium]